MEYKLIRLRIADYNKLKEIGITERRKMIDVISMLLEKKKPNPQLKEKKTHPAFHSLKEIYIEYWHKYNGFEYTSWGVVDASALNRLINQLESINESELSIIEFFRIIMDKLPDFYKNKTINAINKNLPSILSDIKNGKQIKEKFPNIGPLDFRT